MADKTDNSGQSESKPVKLPTERPVFVPTNKIEVKGLKASTDKQTQKPTDKG